MSATTSNATISDTVAAARPRRDARTFWRYLLAFAAPVPFILLAISSALTPYPMEGSTGQAVRAIVENQQRVQTLGWINTVFAWTLVPAGVALLWVCRRHAPVFTAAVGFLVLLGFTSGLGGPKADLLVLVGAQQGVDQAVLVALSDGIWADPTMSVVLLPFLLTITFGRILLGVLLWRVRVAPRWMAIALLLAAPIEFVNVTGGNLQPAIGWALTAIGFASATVALMRMRNDEFDLPPLPAA